MVPFAPQSLQTEGYARANDPLTTSTPTVYTTNYNPHWNSVHPQLYHGRYGEAYYQPIPGPQYTSYLPPAASGLGSQLLECPFAPPREDYTPPQPTYSSSSVLQEMKYDNFGFPNYGFDYTPVCQMPSTSQILVDMDVSTDVQRRTISPNSTLSSSDTGSVGFNSDEQICTHSAVEPDPIVAHLGQMSSNTLCDGRDKEIRTEAACQSKAEKDLERRRKNNEASRKSRAQRRDRFLMEIQEVEFLKKENVRLKELIKELELAIKEANDALIAKFHYQMPPNQSPIM